MTNQQGGLSSYLSAHHRRWLARDDAPRFEVVDGSLLFLDISGFTPLTERLARNGKAGAEELTDHLNHVFGDLMAVSDAFGGDVLKFGGDALFLLFDGDGHQARACATAWDMQVAMRGFLRLKTSAGPAPLKASSSVASGPVHMFLAGGAFDELVIAGPTVTVCLELEKEAEATEMLVAPATIEAVGADHFGDEKAGGRLLTSRPAAEPVAGDGPHGGRVTDARGLPAILHEELEHSQAGEHRQAVVSFIQFKGVDELLDNEGPAAAAGEIDALLSDVQAAFERHEVTFLATDADLAAGKVFACTGAPRAGDDDVDRMLRACTEIVSTPRRLSVRAGVNRGRVFAVHLGAPSRRTYTTMGDTTNLAARVMGRSSPGGVLATRAALEHTRGSFDLEWLEPFNVKGKSMLIEAAAVGGGDGREQDEAVTGHAGPPSGRDVEVGILAEALDGALGGRGASVELRGEAGLGKSALVAHARALASERGMAVVPIQGGAYGRHSAYLALVRPLRRLIGTETDTPPHDVEAALRAAVAEYIGEADDWTGLLAPLVGLDLPLSERVARLDAESQRRRRHLLGAQFVVSLLAGTPALLLAEDTQWLDDAGGEFVRTLSAELSDAGSVVVCARRPPGAEDPEPAPQTRVVDIGPLPDREARRIVLDAVDVDGALPPDAIDAIVRRAAGNPLILMELIALVRAGGAVDEMPEGVEAIMAVRIDAIAPEDRAALRRLAVLGRWMLKRVAARFLDVSEREIEALAGRLDEFVEPAPERGAVRFRHDLVRAAAYEALPFRDRRELHGRAVDVLRDESSVEAGSIELLAMHAQRAGRDEDTWEWGRDGAARALSRGAPSDAVTLFGWAIDASRRLSSVQPRERGKTMEAQGEAAEIAGRYGQAEAAYAAARAERRGEALAVAELCRKQARMCERGGRYSLALGWATRGRKALADVPAGPARDAVAGRLDDVSGFARLRQGRAKEAIVHLEAAVARLETTDDRAALAHASYGLAGALVETGKLDAADALSRRALQLYEQTGDLVGASAVLNNLGVDAYWVGNWHEASELLERAAAMRREMGDVVFAAESDMNVAEIWSDQGRLDDAEDLLRDALAIFRAAPRPECIALSLSDLGRIEARRGDREAAAPLLTESVELFDRIKADGMAYEARVRQAEAAVFAGDAAGALAGVAVVDELAPRVDASHFYRSTVDRIIGWAKALEGDHAGAIEAFDRALVHATELGSSYEEAVARDGAQTVAEHTGTGDPRLREQIDTDLKALGVVSLARPALTSLCLDSDIRALVSAVP